ncbi:hypothetical protein [Marinococcus halophilus]|uniref:hypothetical protein n=1 Tax=Marinococcus halophilus TaxID=1371 RepID=UPI0009A6A73E|nr:hypothetical protein [Marinococcus halophilus]
MTNTLTKETYTGTWSIPASAKKHPADSSSAGNSTVAAAISHGRFIFVFTVIIRSDYFYFIVKQEA